MRRHFAIIYLSSIPYIDMIEGMGQIGSNKKLRLFVEAFDGDNEVMALRLAGFDGSDSYLKQKAAKLLEDPHVQQAIEERNRYIESTKKAVANRTERQAFWTAIMRNDVDELNIRQEYDANNLPKKIENVPLVQRMKASELLGKSETDFVDRVDINHRVSITHLIENSYKDDTPIEAIEAEYERLRAKKEIEQAENVDSESTNEAEAKPSLGDFI